MRGWGRGTRRVKKLQGVLVIVCAPPTSCLPVTPDIVSPDIVSPSSSKGTLHEPQPALEHAHRRPVRTPTSRGLLAEADGNNDPRPAHAGLLPPRPPLGERQSATPPQQRAGGGQEGRAGPARLAALYRPPPRPPPRPLPPSWERAPERTPPSAASGGRARLVWLLSTALHPGLCPPPGRER